MAAPAGFTTFVANKIQDSLGNLLSAGTLLVEPTDVNDKPISSVAGGVGGAITMGPATVAITNGAVPANTYVADTALTKPANICYRLTVKDQTGTVLAVMRYVQPSGATFSLDTYTPNVAAQALVVAGPPGPAGAAGANGTNGTNGVNGTNGTNGIASVANLVAIRNRLPSPPNLHNPATDVTGYYVKTTDGTLAALGGFSTTDYIPANAGGNMYCSLAVNSGGTGFACYDSNYAFISGGQAAAAAAIAIPATAAFIRLTPSQSPIPATMMVTYSAATLTPFVPFAPPTAAAIVTAQQTASLAVQAATLTRLPVAPNLFNPATCTTGYLNTTTGVQNSSAGFSTSDYIPANSGGSMYLNKGLPGGTGYVFYDSSFNYLSGGGSGLAANTAIAVPTLAAFIKVSTTSADATSGNVMMTYSAATLTPFVPFAPVTQSAVIAAEQANVLSFSDYERTKSEQRLGLRGNLFDYTNAPYGLLHADGSIYGGYGTSYRVSGFMYVYGAGFVTSSMTTVCGTGYYTFYDQNQNLLSAGGGSNIASSTPIAVPAGAVYMRVSLNASEVTKNSQIVAGSVLPNAVVPFSYTSRLFPLRGKRAYFNGDSITAQQQWITPLVNYFGLNFPGKGYPSQASQKGAWSSATAYAIGDLVYGTDNVYYSALVATTNVNPTTDNGTNWLNAAASTDITGYSGRGTNDAYYYFAINFSANPSGPTIVQQLTTALSNKDILYLEFGTNDNGTTLGALGDPAYVPGTATGGNFAAVSSYYGVMEYVIKTAVQAVAATGRYIPIIFITPYHNGKLQDHVSGTSPNTIYTITKAVKDVCAEYGVPVIDQSATTTINSTNWPQTVTFDTPSSQYIHINAVGGQIMGMNVARQTMNYLQVF